MSIVVWKQIKPSKKINPIAMRAELEKAVKETVDSADKEFAKTYATWEHKPNFTKGQKTTKVEIRGSTTTTEKGSKDNPYPFVARGTKVRRAIMSFDFKAKTKPGVIGSSGGRGGVVFIGKNVDRPGIKERRFEQEIAKVEKPKFNKRVKKAMRQVRKVSGQPI